MYNIITMKMYKYEFKIEKIFFCICLLGLCNPLYSKTSKDSKLEDSILQEKIPHLTIVPHMGSDDQNLIELMSDSAFAERNSAILVNDNEFVKNPIGIDMNSIDKKDWEFVQDYPIVVRKINNAYDSIVVENPNSYPVVINGQKYYRFYKIKNKKFELLTMDDIKQNLGLKKQDDCMFMINGFILLKDVPSYKIDKSNILRIDLLKSKDIESIRASKNIYIIKILTRWKSNLERHFSRLRQK